MICDGTFDDERKSYAGIRPVPKSIYDIKGRSDADLWMSACDKEVTKLLEMGTFEIVNTEDIPAGHKVMDMCVSFKIKQDSQGNVTEYRAGRNSGDLAQTEQEDAFEGHPLSRKLGWYPMKNHCVARCLGGAEVPSDWQETVGRGKRWEATRSDIDATPMV